MSANDTTHRFGDVTEEPCTLLTPIDGYNTQGLDDESAQLEVIKNDYQENDLRVVPLKEIDPPFAPLEALSSDDEIQSFKNIPMSDGTLTASTAPVAEPGRCSNSELNEYIARCKPRSDVFLIGKRFTDDDIEAIVQQLIITKQCRELYLEDSKVTSQGAVMIAQALRSNNTLERLFISHNKIGDIGAEAFAQCLSDGNNSTLKELCLGNNDITDKGVEHLAAMLVTNQTLTHLLLPSNQITDQGLQQLANVLTHDNKTLECLSLEWNRFLEDASVTILVDMLDNNQTLRTLNLENCRLPRTGIKQLQNVANKKKKFQLSIH